MDNSNISLYDMIGGETGLRGLVDRFYDVMDTASEAKKVRAIHPDDLTQSRDKFFMFLSGWSGGPPLYMEKIGHPRLRQRHMPFPIGKEEHDEWLWCMNKAIHGMPFDAKLVEYLMGKFTEIAHSMRNRVNIDL